MQRWVLIISGFRTISTAAQAIAGTPQIFLIVDERDKLYLRQDGLQPGARKVERVKKLSPNDRENGISKLRGRNVGQRRDYGS